MLALPARPSPLVWILVLTVHGLALLGLQSSKPSSTPDPTDGPRLPRIELRLLAPTVQSAPTAPTHDVEAMRLPMRSSARPVPARLAPPDLSAADALPAAPPATTDDAAVQRTEEESLLDGEATRRALRSSATGAPVPAQLAVEAGAALRAPTASARFGDEVQKAGAGDCTKGQYAGTGMGLLSLPFLAVAALQGDCAK